MLKPEVATNLVRDNLPNWGTTDLSLAHPRDSILAINITTDRDYPPIDRVMMDGISLAWEQYHKGQREFPIIATATPGKPPLQLTNPHSCIEVMTGAPLPGGCDLVIPYEYLRIQAKTAFIVQEENWSPYANIHRQGTDLSAGQLVLAAGTALQPPQWGILASLGYTEITVKKLPRTLIVTTGDELIPPHQTPKPYQLRQSNIYALRSALLKHGYQAADVDTIVLPDDYQMLKEHYQKATQNYEQLIYTGGVSQGKYDFLPSIWSEVGVTCYVHGVKQRPGKPFYFGVDHNYKTAIFGLPGNPVSSLVCLYRYVLSVAPRWAKLATPVVFPLPLTYFLPVRISYSPTAEVLATPVPVNNSGDFLSLANTDGFIELPSDRDEFNAGECFPLYYW
ncbi:MAG: molybdopterin molybdotransferase MoeA [Pseudanabaenaceae cyanobacterium SKYGB_i_bin29]|nr:molybdopterin molybdotransferase MoeA [Pseudanabaenaceae cyanobacterium SKYG29]MDW8422020.1 molybdopterin molybdotransferase MoeA [Pseudanabaenaceae cyanobacterium SKYGB_i_bin29]